MPYRIILSLAVNDDNGEHDGRISSAEVSINHTCIAELDACIWPRSRCPRFTYDRLLSQVKISRQWFPVVGWKAWYGNMAWDAVSVRPGTAADVLNYLRGLKWQNTGGLCEIGHRWDSGETFRSSDIAALTLTDRELYNRKVERGFTGTFDEYMAFGSRVYSL
jgi:hypothetical protein